MRSCPSGLRLVPEGFTLLLLPQVYIRIRDDEWNVYRRYTEFRSLHHKLQSRFPQVRAYSFPPKKAIGNKVPPAIHRARLPPAA